MTKPNNYKLFLFFLFFFSSIIILHARDINFDSIYLNNDSDLSQKLIHYKIDTYEKAEAQFIDKKVIFADWTSGSDIVYIKEFSRINIVYTYNRKHRTKEEIKRVKGTITTAKASPNRKYLFLKIIIIQSNGYPLGKTVMLNIASKEMRQLPGEYPFLDFSLSPSGNSLLYQVKNGIMELYPESQIKKLLHNKNDYKNVLTPGSPVVAFLSPNRKKSFIVSGEGGNYRAKILDGHKQKNINGISSIGEIYWLNNKSLIYRKGSPGYYTVNIFDIQKNSEKKVFGPTFNSNITYSKYPGIITFLQDQVIQVYDIRAGNLFNTSLEGEDVKFTPDGSRFISLLNKKLFITKLNILKRKKLEIKKPVKKIFKIYNKLLANKDHWSNNYSLDYLKRKILIYKKLSQ
jgi:hypothetical protein